MKRFWSVAIGVAGRNLRVLIARPLLFLPPIIAALMLLAAFAGGLAAVGNVAGFQFHGNYTAFEVVFALFQGAAFCGVVTGATMAGDFESGFARRLLLAAPNRRAILAGYLLTSLVRALLTVIVVFAVGVATGADVHGSPLDLAGLLGLGLLVAAMAALWAAGLALRLRTVQAGPLMTMTVFIILFLGPAWVPLLLLSGWIHTAALANPVTAIFEAGRGLISGQPRVTIVAFAAAAGSIVLLAVWSLTGLAKAEQAS